MAGDPSCSVSRGLQGTAVPIITVTVTGQSLWENVPASWQAAQPLPGSSPGIPARPGRQTWRGGGRPREHQLCKPHKGRGPRLRGRRGWPTGMSWPAPSPWPRPWEPEHRTGCWQARARVSTAACSPEGPRGGERGRCLSSLYSVPHMKKLGRRAGSLRKHLVGVTRAATGTSLSLRGQLARPEPPNTGGKRRPWAWLPGSTPPPLSSPQRQHEPPSLWPVPSHEMVRPVTHGL